jgi:hypothetical protein
MHTRVFIHSFVNPFHLPETDDHAFNFPVRPGNRVGIQAERFSAGRSNDLGVLIKHNAWLMNGFKQFFIIGKTATDFLS